jgi:AcrR family transcriptional regulator
MPKVTEEYLDSRRQHIIDSAYRCFARKGFHQTTMRDIYAEAGLSPGAIYHYFSSKDEIIEASFIFDYQRSRPIFEQAAANADPLAAIDDLLQFFYGGLETAAALGADRVNIQGWGEALFNPRLLSPLRIFFHDFQELLAGLVRRAQAAGNIDERFDPEATGEVVLASFLGLYLQKAMIPELEVGRYKDVVMALFHGSFVHSPKDVGNSRV